MGIDYRWRRSAIYLESLRNATVTGPARLLLILAILFGVILGSIEAFRSQQFVSDLAQARDLGDGLIVITGTGPDAATTIVDRASCENLNEINGVVRAGIIDPAGYVDTVEYGPGVPVFYVSAELIAGVDEGDLVIGSTLAKGRTGPTERLVVDGAVTRARAGAHEPTGVDVGAAISALAPASVTDAPTCVVEVEPGARTSAWLGIVSSSVSAVGGPVDAREASTQVWQPTQQFLQGPLRWSALALGLVAGLLSAWRRLGEDSTLLAYTMSGTSRRELLLILGFEQVVPAGVFVASAIGTVSVLAAWVSDPKAVILRARAGGLAWVAVHAMGSCAVVLSRKPGMK